MMGGNMMRGKRWTGAAAVLFALLFAACEAKSPTAPNPGGGPGTEPPTSASVDVSVSNANPLVNSTATITVTVSGAANGTAVEYATDLGTFVDTAAASTVRTTTDGKATAILTSGQVGSAKVTVRVNNVVKTVTITFKDQPDTPGEPVPQITSFSPVQGKPSGGELITIKGTNFAEPVRVLFGTTEAAIASVTDTEIRAVAPEIQLSLDEQARDVSIVVITQAGQTGEQSTTSTSTYRYELEVLTPKILDVSPSSGPNEGNTRITIYGDGFQSPLKVFFGTAGTSGAPLTNQVEATVLQVTYNQVVALTPAANGLGAELANSQVTIRVVNVQSGTDAVSNNIYRYGPMMQITSVGPTEGPATGGTQVTINGWGFDDPVAVVIGGIAAQPVRVSGTQIVAVTSAPNVSSCGDVKGPVKVTNVSDGTSADGPEFTYRVPTPVISSVTPSQVIEGGNIQITVQNAGSGAARFTIGDKTRLPSSSTDLGGGTIRYTVVAPTGLEFTSQSCGVNGTQFVPLSVDIAYTNATTTCEDTLPGALLIVPLDSSCHETPEASVAPASLDFGQVPTGSTSDLAVTITNVGGDTLTISAVASDTPAFTIVTPVIPANLGGGASQAYTIRFAPIAIQAYSGTITFTTNAGDVTVTVAGEGVAP